MLAHDLRHDEGILVLHPDSPLETTDFKTLTTHVDAYLENNGMLHGVMVVAPEFPGWKDFGALLAHMRFVRQHHHKIEKIAVVSDGAVATALPHIAQHFIHAHVKHFAPADEDAAHDWLLQSDHARVRTAA